MSEWVSDSGISDTEDVDSTGQPDVEERMARRFGREDVSLSVLIWFVGDKLRNILSS